MKKIICCDCGAEDEKRIWTQKRCSGCTVVAGVLSQRRARRKWKVTARASGVRCSRCERNTGVPGLCVPCRDYVRKWKSNNRLAVAGHKAKRPPESFKADKFCAVLLQRQGGVCVACRTPEGPWHVDHVIPVCSGGGSGIENLQVLCAPCNLRKGRKSMSAFMCGRGLLAA